MADLEYEKSPHLLHGAGPMTYNYVRALGVGPRLTWVMSPHQLPLCGDLLFLSSDKLDYLEVDVSII